MAGLGSFVDGFVGGVDTRHKWDDRNRQRKLDDEDRVWQNQQRDWQKDDRGYTLEERQRQRSREDKAQAEQDRVTQAAADERKAAADAYDAAKGGDTGSPGSDSAPNAAASVSRSLDLPNFGASSTPLSFGANVPALPNAMAPGGGGQPMALPGMMGRSIAPPAMSQPTYPGPAGSPPLVVQPGPTADQWNAMTGAQRDAYQPTMGQQRALPQAALDPNRPTAQLLVDGDPGMMGTDAQKMAWASNAPAREQAALNAQATPDKMMVTPRSRSLSGAGDTSASVAAVLPAPNASPAQAAAASDPGAMANNPAASPAVQIAAATAPKPRLAFGIDAPTIRSPAQTKVATDNFMQNYLDKGVPKLMEYYMKTGQMDKAQAFQTWANDTQNQTSMKMWAEGVHAAAIGDETKMLDSFSQYYNRFDNGEEIVREKSGIKRDGNGNMTGATLTFKDTKTGVEHTQDLNGTEELLQQGIMALSPEKMFEMMYSQEGAKLTARSNTIKYQQQMAIAMVRYGAQRGIKTTPQRVTAIMADMSRNVMGFNQLPQEKQIAMVTDRIASENQAAGIADNQPDPSAGDLPIDYGTDPNGDPNAQQ